MIDAILKKSVSDPHLARLAEEARDNAEVYLLAKKRQKGCDGMGEVRSDVNSGHQITHADNLFL